MSNLRNLRITNVRTGERFVLNEDQIEIEIDGDGLVSIMTPEVGSREFLLNIEELESARGEISRG